MRMENKYRRYQKQILLKEFGTSGQNKLRLSKVLVIGAGGLGCPALQYLAAAGVGVIGIVDFDLVELSNLQRQVLYGMEDIGQLKAETAAKKLRAMNPDIEVHVYNERLQDNNAFKMISSFDLVIDGTDNFETRYLVNDACVILNKPLVYGAVLKFEGQVGVFNFEDKITNVKTNYRDLFPLPPMDGVSCNDVGVIGAIPGIIGTMQAMEAIKIITGIGSVLCNKIVSYNALNNAIYEVEVLPLKDLNLTIPKDEKAFLNFNYDFFRNSTVVGSQITPEALDDLRKKEIISIIDVRDADELPLVAGLDCIRIPMAEFEMALDQLSTANKIVLICRSGKRSSAALQILNTKFPGCKAFSLVGGIDAWHERIKSSI